MGKKKKPRKISKRKKKLIKFIEKLKPKKKKDHCKTCDHPYICDFCLERQCFYLEGCHINGFIFNVMFEGIEVLICSQCREDGIMGEPLQRWYTEEGEQITKEEWEVLNDRKSP